MENQLIVEVALKDALIFYNRQLNQIEDEIEYSQRKENLYVDMSEHIKRSKRDKSFYLKKQRQVKSLLESGKY